MVEGDMKSTLSIRITVRGRLSERLAAAFDGMTPMPRNSGTDLVGEVVDHAQLHGLLTRPRPRTRVRVHGRRLHRPRCTRQGGPDMASERTHPPVQRSAGSRAWERRSPRTTAGIRSPTQSAVALDYLRTGDRFRVGVARERALDAFYHPFAYLT